MKESSVPVVVLTESRDDVEFVNKTLRDAGNQVRCHGVNRLDTFEEILQGNAPHLLIYFNDRHKSSLREVAKIRQTFARMSPLVVLAQKVDETTITAAQQLGANDLVSIANKARFCFVCERELRSFRLERALNNSLKSAKQYKDQLKAFMSVSSDAIAHVHEGIIVEANKAWAEFFANANADDALGPVMDFFAERSHATLKGALTAAAKGQWDGDALKLEAITTGGKKSPIEIDIQKSSFDGEPAIKLSMKRGQAPDTERPAEVLVEQVLQTDPVTGYFLRQQFLQVLTDKLDQRSASGARALVYVRPDRFAEVERSVGPLASEELIGQIAEMFGRLLGETDVAGRFGGTVLTFMIERGSLRDIQAWAENAVNRIAEHIFEVADHSLSLTCSIGIAEMGEGTDRVENLIRSAESANRRCRSEGGNGVMIEETADESTRIKRIDALWVHQIKSALVDGRFKLVQLSVANLGGKSERMFDTVVKMIDEQGDEIAAADFIPTARRNKLLRPIDRWIIEASLDFCSREATDLVFVKLSGESILDVSVLSWIGERIKATGVKPANLCFQVSEENASQYQKQTVGLATALRRIGCRFAVENFGIGRDPLRVLSNIPMDYVKLDGSFMQQIADDHATQEKIRAFVSNASRNQIQTIATRVENANTMAVLFQLGVAYMQGHYLHEAEVVLEEAI